LAGLLGEGVLNVIAADYQQTRIARRRLMVLFWLCQLSVPPDGLW